MTNRRSDHAWPTLALADARGAIARWRADGLGRTVRSWILVSAAIAVGLLSATALIASRSQPGDSYDLAGVSRPGEFSDMRYVLTGNLLVLALHALACAAAYLARRSLIAESAGYRGFWRQLNTRIGAWAMWFVAAATVFSFISQARALGVTAAATAAGLGISSPALLTGLAPHALPELTAVFLPLAAWLLVGARARRWNDLLAATFISTAVAVPVVVACAVIEVYVSPHVVRMIAG